MSLYYSADGIEIHLGDCRDILPTISLGPHALVTDPPYGHGKRWNGGTWASNAIYDDAKRWDAQTFPNDALVTIVSAATGGGDRVGR